MNDQLYILLEKLVQKNKISIHKEELKLQLLSHPSYPSLHALTGVLDHLGIPNIAARLQVNEHILNQLPRYFMAMLAFEEKEDLVLVENKPGSIKLTFNTRKVEKITIEAFLSLWNGIIVAIEKDSTVKEVRQNPASTMVKWSVPVLVLMLTTFFFINTDSPFPIIHFIASLLGLILSIVIVKQELGYTSHTANNICNFSEKTSCDAILNSKGATFFGFLKLSDVSLVVFSGYILTWVLYLLAKEEMLSIINIFTLLSIPVIFYSIFYQAVLLKKWCPLCLGIIGVLLLQVGALLFTEAWTASLLISGNSLGLYMSSFLLVITIWFSLKPMLERKGELEKLEIAHFKFKKKFSLFKALLKNDTAKITQEAIEGEIVFGNIHAPIELVLVTSPFCYYCKIAHTDIDKILLSAKDKLKVTLRFRVDPNDKHVSLYKVVSEVLHVYHTQGQTASQKVLAHLYSEDVNINAWLENTNIHYSPDYDAVMKQQKEWCLKNGINFTPALYINGQEFPREYERIDLLLFIDDLTEEAEKTGTLQTLHQNKVS